MKASGTQRTPKRVRVEIGLSLLVAVTCPSPVWAETNEAVEVTPASQCVAHAERAQEFHHAGDFAQARAEVALCAQVHCPTLVRNDCESWLHEWAEPQNRPLPAPSTTAGRDAPLKETLPSTNPLPREAAQPSPRIWPWLATAVGVAGGVGFAYLGLQGKREAETLADTCGRDKSCRESEVQPVRTKLLFADVSLGVGIVGFGVAILGFVTSGGDAQGSEHAGTQRPASTSKQPTLQLGGSSVTARFVF